MRLKRGLLIGLVIYLTLLFSLATFGAPDPSGAAVNPLKTGRGYGDVPNANGAMAGNATEIDITGDSITQSWQGYYGNVSGTITLDDASNYSMYNWTLASPEGEVYASNSSSVTWTNVQCFNFTALGNYTNYTEDAEQKGATNLYGKNLSMLETEFNISWDDMDGVNETFNFTQEGDVHNQFYVGNLEFTAGECLFTRIFGDSGQGENDEFEEILLWDPDSNSTIFASLLENNVLGFDNTPKDFEMMVLENGNNGDTAITNYWFYIEIE